MKADFVRYLSTRDPRTPAPTLSFEGVLVAGLAEDGGLFVPDHLPRLGPPELRACSGLPYPALAARVAALFAGESFSAGELARLAADAYGDFRHSAVAPLRQLDEKLWLLELFHGPTLAFKDLALQFLGRLLDAALARSGEHVTVVGATSGDTGSAAIAACRDRAGIDVFILYPHGRVSEVQRRQMTTVDAPNVHAVAIEGTFDDCQDLVKALFANSRLRQELNLAAVNSINWARIAAQIVYYIAAGLALGAPGRAVSFSVPTGNFGNVYAGHLARRIGLPIARLVIGTNRNDILVRYFASGEMAIAPVAASLSPSMDIQISSNFERLLFELYDRDGAAVARAVQLFRATGSLPRDEGAWRAARQLFSAHRIDDQATVQTIGDTYGRTGVLIDPHSAVAVAAARAELAQQHEAFPMVALACAHPAKFPDAVERATGLRPALPPDLADLFERRERTAVLPADVATIGNFILARSRRKEAAA